MSDHKHEYGTISLSLEDGTEFDCLVLEIFPVNGKTYIALQPILEDEDKAKLLLYQYMEEDHDDNPQLLNIKDDDEFEAVVDAFEEILDDYEFDEIPENE